LASAKLDVLQKLVAETQGLKKYRTNGTVYFEKCAELLERIKVHFNTLKIETLTVEQAEILNLLKSNLAAEEDFAKSSFENRNPAMWKEFLNE
jgi:hypothetical protein